MCNFFLKNNLLAYKREYSTLLYSTLLYSTLLYSTENEPENKSYLKGISNGK